MLELSPPPRSLSLPTDLSHLSLLLHPPSRSSLPPRNRVLLSLHTTAFFLHSTSSLASRNRASSPVVPHSQSRLSSQQGEAADEVLLDDDPSEPTMGEKLASLSLLDENISKSDKEQESSVLAKPPSADSVHVLLNQALNADDRALLLDCFYTQDEKCTRVYDDVGEIWSCGGLRYLKPSCIRCCTTLSAASAAAPPPSVKKMRVVSGVQSTGAIHLGNYFGDIKNWVALQITLPYDDIQQLSKSTRSTAAIYLACGVDPSKVYLNFFLELFRN
ncbi:hypothetical protein RIF29_20251 [Crotalaria pallida]|uniref:Uncharacterized protein n=1 Tax=Crotalaria pallida TaxID=3830 RepID=A0AAN9F9B3_CROPI